MVDINQLPSAMIAFYANVIEQAMMRSKDIVHLFQKKGIVSKLFFSIPVSCDIMLFLSYELFSNFFIFEQNRKAVYIGRIGGFRLACISRRVTEKILVGTEQC